MVLWTAQLLNPLNPRVTSRTPHPKKKHVDPHAPPPPPSPRSYPLLKGDTDLTKLLRLLRPKVLVPLLNADLDQEGLITPLMSVRGSSAADALRRQLAAAGLGDIRLEYPAPPGESLSLAL